MLTPKITAIMPVFNSEEYLEEAITSIINQSYTDWEFLIILEAGSSKKSKEILSEYEKKDDRILVIENKKKLGLAQSLNKGIGLAKGEYIARIDADDYSYPNRFEIQVAFLNNREDLDLCGTLQETLRPTGEKVKLEVASEPDKLKAEMIFGCQLSHCSIMFRKKTFIDNEWYYSEQYYGEDYELWTRIRHEIKYANIDQYLVIHRYGFGSISLDKGDKLENETRNIIKNIISNDFNIDVHKYRDLVFGSWRKRLYYQTVLSYEDFLLESYSLIIEIEKSYLQQSTRFYEKEALVKTLCKRWNWAVANTVFNHEYLRLQNLQIPPVDFIPEENFSTILTKYLFQDANNVLGKDEKEITNIIREKIDNIKQHFLQIVLEQKQVIIYGLGQQLLKYLAVEEVRDTRTNIVALTESQISNRYKDNDVPLVESQDITKMKFDYILISTDAFYEEIYEYLVTKLNIEKNKILPPFVLKVLDEIEQSSPSFKYKI